MAKTLNFNSLKKPTLPLVMKDKQKTEIPVTTPTEGLVEKLQVSGREFESVFESGDPDGIKAAYNLAAELISCNLLGLQVTAEDLRDKYALNLYDLVFFFGAYTDFLAEIANTKN